MRLRGEIVDAHADAPFDRRLARLVDGRDPRLRAWNSACFAPALHRLITAPGILDPLEALLGGEIAFNGDYHLRPKLPGSDAGIAHWHQDSQYFGPETAELRILTVMVALVDTTEENGCLWVAPGSHQWGFEPIAPDAGTEDRVRRRSVAEGRALRPCLLRAGDILVFSNLTYHGSQANRSGGIRWTIDLRYSAAPAFLDDHAGCPASRFRRHLNAIGYTPFLARSRRGPACTWDEWQSQHLERNAQGLARMDRYA